MSAWPIPHERRLIMFFRRVVKRENGCWEWTGGRNRGYGVLSYKGKYDKAHRLSYMWLKADIPNGLELDHLCRNPPCVNPDHLEAVTRKINASRGSWAMKTHCPQGHEYSAKNLVPSTLIRRPNPGRACSICARARAALQHAKKMEAKCRHS